MLLTRIAREKKVRGRKNMRAAEKMMPALLHLAFVAEKMRPIFVALLLTNAAVQSATRREKWLPGATIQPLSSGNVQDLQGMVSYTMCLILRKRKRFSNKTQDHLFASQKA